MIIFCLQNNLVNKENLKNCINCLKKEFQNVDKDKTISDVNTLGISAIEDINSVRNDDSSLADDVTFKLEAPSKINTESNRNVLIPSSPIEIYDDSSICSEKTVIYDVNVKPVITVSFCVSNCDNVDVSTNNSNIKKVSLAHNKNAVDVDCEIVEGSELSEESKDSNLNMTNSLLNSCKRKAVSVNLEIKKQKVTDTEEKTEIPKILILKTNAIEKLTHIIVQPPNYKLVKRKINDINYINSKQSSYVSVIKHGKNFKNEQINQTAIDTYFKSDKVTKINKSTKDSGANLLSNEILSEVRHDTVVRDDAQEMNRNSGITDLVGLRSHKTLRDTSKSPRISLPQTPSPKREVKGSISEAPRASSSRSKKESSGSLSPRKNIDAIHFTLPVKSRLNKTTVNARTIPHHKIVAGDFFDFWTIWKIWSWYLLLLFIFLFVNRNSFRG